jgi:hypothetical protein
MFADEIQEQAFSVQGGLLWFHHVLIAAVEVMSKSYQVPIFYVILPHADGFPKIRLYSRDLELSNQNVLHREVTTTPVVILSLVDNSLLVYTADNTLFHFLIIPTSETIKLHLCGSISFNGIITAPRTVKVLSWMIPAAQKRMSFVLACRPSLNVTLIMIDLGDPIDDLSVATVLMMVGGQLVLLRPRKVGLWRNVVIQRADAPRVN